MPYSVPSYTHSVAHVTGSSVEPNAGGGVYALCTSAPPGSASGIAARKAGVATSNRALGITRGAPGSPHIPTRPLAWVCRRVPRDRARARRLPRGCVACACGVRETPDCKRDAYTSSCGKGNLRRQHIWPHHQAIARRRHMRMARTPHWLVSLSTGQRKVCATCQVPATHVHSHM